MAPDNLESAVNENVKLRVEILTIAKELKKCKKLLMQQDRDLAATARERDDKGGKRRDAESREMEALWREEKAKREAAEEEHKKLSEDHLDKIRALEDELDDARGQIDDQAEEMSRLRDTADIAQDELEKVREEARGLTESVGIGRGREARTIAKLEQEIADLKADLELAQKGAGADLEELEERINEWRDKHAAALIDIERRDQEIDDLNQEIDAKVADHEREIAAVENEWRDEVVEARGQVDELRDVLAEREQEAEEYRKLLQERDEEVIVARDRIIELEAAQGETHDRLTETLRNIEMDNATKEDDIIAANQEVERVSLLLWTRADVSLPSACSNSRKRPRRIRPSCNVVRRTRPTSSSSSPPSKRRGRRPTRSGKTLRLHSSVRRTRVSMTPITIAAHSPAATRPTSDSRRSLRRHVIAWLCGIVTLPKCSLPCGRSRTSVGRSATRPTATSVALSWRLSVCVATSPLRRTTWIAHVRSFARRSRCCMTATLSLPSL